MSTTIWNGNGTLVSATKGAGVRVAIASIANTSPIAVTTLGVHGFNTEDSVEIEGTSGVADGQYQITKVDGTHFLLNGTTANGTSGSGYIVDYELQPAYQMPANGTLADVNDVITLGEGLSNPIPYLYRRTGKWRLYNQYYINNAWFSSPFVSNPWSTNNNFTSVTVTPMASSTTTFESSSDTTSIPPVFAVGDLLEISTSFTISTTTHTGTQYAAIEVGFGLVQGGSLLSTIGIPSVLVQANYLNGGSFLTPCHVSGFFGPLVAGSGGGTFPAANLSYCLFARLDYISAANQIDLLAIGQWSGTVKQWRPN